MVIDVTLVDLDVVAACPSWFCTEVIRALDVIVTNKGLSSADTTGTSIVDGASQSIGAFSVEIFRGTVAGRRVARVGDALSQIRA